MVNQRKTLRKKVRPILSPYCMHVKGHGGVKGALRLIHRQTPRFKFVARFDVDSYYSSMRHDVLLDILSNNGEDEDLQEIVRSYLDIPDRDAIGAGMVAGGSISPLLGALYLLPLDCSFDLLVRSGKLYYIRYMDDIIIMARTPWTLRRAIKKLFAITGDLSLRMHRKEKYPVGSIEKGFDFLGYQIKPNKRLKPSSESLRCLVKHAYRLYE